ncbi:hypothetical protein, partial [Kitasatospora sp. NPDC005751]|uniref:hypothetical protein n=1 Tax=Kitasatospora sp. NPDC005751 TaxID=3157064 RepID=UPI003408B2E2
MTPGSDDEAATVLIESIVAAVNAGDDRRSRRLLRSFSERADLEAFRVLCDDLRERARQVRSASPAAQVGDSAWRLSSSALMFLDRVCSFGRLADVVVWGPLL